MTHKGLVKILDSMIATICERRGIDPRTEVKGGQVEVANSFLAMALKDLTETILTAAQAPKRAEGWGEVGGGGSANEAA